MVEDFYSFHLDRKACLSPLYGRALTVLRVRLPPLPLTLCREAHKKRKHTVERTTIKMQTTQRELQTQGGFYV